MACGVQVTGVFYNDAKKVSSHSASERLRIHNLLSIKPELKNMHGISVYGTRRNLNVDI